MSVQLHIILYRLNNAKLRQNHLNHNQKLFCINNTKELTNFQVEQCSKFTSSGSQKIRCFQSIDKEYCEALQ